MSKSQKGSAFERDVSKKLTLWISGSKRPYLFWRMPGSGSLATIFKENTNLSGDIAPLDEKIKQWWPFHIECKNGYPKTSFWQHFTGVNFNIKEFWNQCITETPLDKHPILIYRKKNRKPIIGINKYIYDMLEDKLKYLNKYIVSWPNELEELYLLSFDEFLNTIKPEDIKDKWQN